MSEQQDPPQGWRDMMWKLTQKAKAAERRCETAAQEEVAYIVKFLRDEASDIMGNAMAGRGDAPRCDAAVEALELAAEMIESGDYRK